MIRPRKDEVEAVIEALDAEYDDAKGAATAVIQLVAGLLAKRETHALVVDWAGGRVYGPFGDLRAAKKAGTLAASTFAPDAPEGSVRVIPLGAPAMLSESLTAPPGGTVGCECGHAWGAHMDQRYKKWRKGVKDWSKEPWQKPGCTHCKCKNIWTQPKK